VYAESPVNVWVNGFHAAAGDESTVTVADMATAEISARPMTRRRAG